MTFEKAQNFSRKVWAAINWHPLTWQISLNQNSLKRFRLRPKRWRICKPSSEWKNL